MRTLIGMLIACGLTTGAGTDVAAQKSKDTMRIAVTENVSRLSAYYFPQPDGNFFFKELYDNLVTYDESNKKFLPSLAKSWQRIDDTTLEFDLRDDITFHNGHGSEANRWSGCSPPNARSAMATSPAITARCANRA